MRRSDREIKELDDIVEVLRRCDTVSLGFNGQDGPYVVPVSFGVARAGDAVTLYFHGANRGEKADRIAADPRVCVEGHVFYRVEPVSNSLTTRYESVIGFGTVQAVDEREAVAGLQSIAEHYRCADTPIASCKSLPMTKVYRITLCALTGKRNLPE